MRGGYLQAKRDRSSHNGTGPSVLLLIVLEKDDLLLCIEIRLFLGLDTVIIHRKAY